MPYGAGRPAPKRPVGTQERERKARAALTLITWEQHVLPHLTAENGDSERLPIRRQPCSRVSPASQPGLRPRRAPGEAAGQGIAGAGRTATAAPG